MIYEGHLVLSVYFINWTRARDGNGRFVVFWSSTRRSFVVLLLVVILLYPKSQNHKITDRITRSCLVSPPLTSPLSSIRSSRHNCTHWSFPISAYTSWARHGVALGHLHFHGWICEPFNPIPTLAQSLKKKHCSSTRPPRKPRELSHSSAEDFFGLYASRRLLKKEFDQSLTALPIYSARAA